MIAGDEGMESIYLWNEDGASEGYRGASGGGDGVHILTGPIFVEEAEAGDILMVEILDLRARVNPEGRAFGSNAAAWWGFQARVDQSDNTTFDAGDFTGTPGRSCVFTCVDVWRCSCICLLSFLTLLHFTQTPTMNSLPFTKSSKKGINPLRCHRTNSNGQSSKILKEMSATLSPTPVLAFLSK